jgi:translocation and assembly module TamB
VALALVVVVESRLAERWFRHEIARQIEDKTGARVEIGGFHLHFWRLRAEIENLTLHGLEGPGAPPLFHADRVNVAIRILSFLGRQIALDELIVERPQLAVSVGKDGRSNLPAPKVHSIHRPWRETLFDLQIGLLELNDGNGVFNNRHIPLNAQGRNLEFTLHYVASEANADSYIGFLRWQQVQIADRKDAPFHLDISMKFALHRDAFELDELVCNLPHSTLNLRAELPTFAEPDWRLHYRGRLSLADVREVFRQPTTPDGIADFSGQARYASGEWTAAGHYTGRDIAMHYQWFHAGGFETWGDYELAANRLKVPNLSVRALGAHVDGSLHMDLHGLAFRTETRLRGASLAQIFAALNNPQFPVNSLHWDGSVDVDSTNTWDANFKNFRTQGETRWSPPANLSPGMIPVTARIEYDYSEHNRGVVLQQGEITTPHTRLEMDGKLGADDSALELKLKTGDLLEWDDFINVIRGADAEPRRIGGSVEWAGQIIGPLGGPTFAGHLHASEAQYDKLDWDLIDGDLEYSPEVFRLTNTTVRHSQASARVNLALQFDGRWSFLPESAWTLDAHTDRAPTTDLQTMFDTNYPVSGYLSGEFRGSGTRAAPVLDSDFALQDIAARELHFDRLTGQFHMEDDELRLSRGELRMDGGRIVGNIAFRPQEQEVEFDLIGKGISLEQIHAIQSASLQVTGQMDFELKGKGPARAPVARGDLRLANARVGSESQGSFHGQLTSDGQTARLSLTSELTRGKLQGQFAVGLAGDMPVSGRLSVEQFDLDPLIVAALHLKQLTSHSSVDGLFTVSGDLRRPETLEVDANITSISFAYQFVQLTNDGPVHLVYKRNEVRVQQAHLRGPNTDLQLEGVARFDDDRPLHFTLSGGVNLQLLKGVLPDLAAKGRADANVSVEGTIRSPRITGHAHVQDASASYADFPVGLSNLNGDFVFDTSRLLFDNVSADSGGGHLTLNGNVNYGDGPFRYEINAKTSVLRIRYPTGMSWLASGALQLEGTGQAALISGRVVVQRVLLAEGVDVAALFAAASDTTSGPAPSSPFLQNLSFDVEGSTSPGARVEWTGAHVEMDGDVRLRGTWDHPVLLGHIHLLGGQMAFRGNNFDLTRGDINFANPFRLDPVLNVEAVATINQYQVTINFSGPASRLSLNYRSDPPLPDSDVIALLALGTTGQESALRSQSVSSQNYGATALLSEAISTGLGGRIERLFGISHFRVDPFLAGTATETNAAARVTIEQQVTRDLTITYSTNATSTQQQLIQAEYTLTRGLSVVFLRDVNGTYGLDVKFVKRLK